ncbi:Guanine nucleotide-binding protein subunit beta-2-like protein, partial [Leptotrombidium deliense]
MAKDKDEEQSKLEEELKELESKIKNEQKLKSDKSFVDICNDVSKTNGLQVKCRRVMRGHLNKVNDVDFSGDSRFLVSAALEGKLIIWDTWSGNKIRIIPLMSSWMMSCAFASSGSFVACGGMDNMCTIYDVTDKNATGSAKIRRELMGFEGFLSACRFVNDNQILTGSNMKIILWDLEKNVKISEFQGHCGDVLTLSLSPDLNTFVSGSVDVTAKLWDIRDASCKQTFWGHTADVNSVYYHKSGFAFVTGSEDKSSRLFDIRADQEIAKYLHPTSNSGFTCCALSASGRYLICGSDDHCVHFWDTLKVEHIGTLTGHSNRITSLSIADNGMAFATGSWDTNLHYLK